MYDRSGGGLRGLSSDGTGRRLAFSTDAHVTPTDQDYWTDVFVFDADTGRTVEVSVSSRGAQGDGESERPDMSSDGKHVAFESWATNLVRYDTNDTNDIFVHNLQSS